MNERVQQIIKEAERNWYETHRVYDEILIELVVKECLKIVDYAGEDVEHGNVFLSETNAHLKELEESDYKRIGAVAWYASDKIKEHFGVEESAA